MTAVAVAGGHAGHFWFPSSLHAGRTALLQSNFKVFWRLSWSHWSCSLHHAHVLPKQRALGALLLFLVGRRLLRQFLFARAAGLSLSANFKFQFLTLGNVLRIVAETIEELALNYGLRPVLLLFLA